MTMNNHKASELMKLLVELDEAEERQALQNVIELVRLHCLPIDAHDEAILDDLFVARTTTFTKMSKPPK